MDGNKHVGNAVPKTNLVHPEILNLFWVLAEVDDTKRLHATKNLLKRISDKQSPLEKDKLCPDLLYCLSRLVKGLSSHRRLARLGFSTAFCQVLTTFPQIETADVIKLIEDALKSGKQDSKYEQGNVALGKAFGYIALIQSGRLSGKNGCHAKSVLTALVNIKQEKSYIQQLCNHGIAQIIKKVDKNVFRQHVWPVLEAELSAGWMQCHPDTLELLILCSKHQQDVVNKKFLHAKWNSRHLINTENFLHIKDVIANSTSLHPIIHGVNQEICDELPHTLLEEFWGQVIGPLWVQGISRKLVVLHYFLNLLSKVKDSRQIRTMMTSELCSTWLRSLATKDSPMHEMSKTILLQLGDFLRSHPDGAVQFAVIKCVLCSIPIQRASQGNAIPGLIACLNEDGANLFAAELKRLVKGKNVFKEKSESLDNSQKWAVMELRSLVTLPSTGHKLDWQIDLLKFLFNQAFFTVVKKVDGLEYCDKVSKATPTQGLQQTCQSSFFKALNNLANFNPGKGQKRDPHVYINIVYDVMKYAEELLSHSEEVVAVKSLPEEAMEQWRKVMVLVDGLHVKNNTLQQMGEGHAFELLFMFLGLQLFTNANNALEILQDLYICYDKAFQKKTKVSKKAEYDEPDWMEVVTELLLSILAQESHLARVVVGNVFALLMDHISVEALALILNVLQPTKLGDDEDDSPIGFEDDASPDEDDDDEEEEKEESASESSDSDDDDDDALGDNKQDQNVRETVKAALGEAADQSDEDELEDLSDSEMLKQDEALSEAFRSMKKGKDAKEKKSKIQRITTFKSRVLDLIDVIVKSQPSSEITVNLVCPLLDMMEAGKRQKDDQPLAARATAIFHNMCKQKISRDSITDGESLLVVIKDLIQVASQVSGNQMVKEVSSGCLFLIRILLNLELSLEPSPVKTRSQSSITDDNTEMKKDYEKEIVDLLRSTLSDILYKRDSHLSPVFVQHMIGRHPVLFWPLSTFLLDSVASPDVRVFCKTKACSMLASMLNKKMPEAIGEKLWMRFCKSMYQKSAEVIGEMKSGDIKPRFVHEFLLLLHHFLLALGGSEAKSIPDSVGAQLPGLLDIVKKDSKKLLARVLSLTGNKINKQEPNPKDKKRKLSKSKQLKEQAKSESKVKSDEVLQMSPSPKKKHKKQKSSEVVTSSSASYSEGVTSSSALSSEGVTSSSASPLSNDNAGKKVNKRKSQTSKGSIDNSEPHKKASKINNKSV